MASLLEKIGTLISANLHYMVDEALKSNSIAVFDQYIRQVDNNLDELEDAAATVGGEARMLRRKYDEFAAKTAELDRNIDIFLSEGREELAAAAQTKFNSTKRLADSYKDQADRQQSEYQKLLDARLKLEAKLTTVKQEREELQALLTLAKSKEVSVKAIKSLDDLVGSGDADVARRRFYPPAWTRRRPKATWLPPASIGRWTTCWSARRSIASWKNANAGWA
ncbi:MAG: PspA/IM30 family protein [Anaerolineae bacterium]|uniref:PspA/IM30 family protein n=1 Tax=Candidatus Amarolinea dominans TaxID=3140696 RepID=UPI0031373DC9|nr:PspA/IM30 family protein [Anaerolineae bacterium]